MCLPKTQIKPLVPIFNMPGHALADLRVAVIEQTRGKSSAYRKEREHYYIRKFDTFYHGLNRQK